MSLQARMSAVDQRLYNPGRDVAHNFGDIMMEVAERLEAGVWDTPRELLKEKGVSEAEMGKCCEALLLFVAGHMDHKESMAAGLQRTGFLDLNPYARLVIMAHLGTVILGVHWAGVREATIGGEGPALTYQDLRARGAECAKLMTMPAWKRPLYRAYERLQRAWTALRG